MREEKFVSFIVRLLAHNSSIFAVSRKGPPMAVRVDSSMTEKSGTFVITSDKGITNGTTKATKSNIGVSNAGNSTWQINQGEFRWLPSLYPVVNLLLDVVITYSSPVSSVWMLLHIHQWKTNWSGWLLSNTYKSIMTNSSGLSSYSCFLLRKEQLTQKKSTKPLYQRGKDNFGQIFRHAQLESGL